jgi:hypothetical protein
MSVAAIVLIATHDHGPTLWYSVDAARAGAETDRRAELRAAFMSAALRDRAHSDEKMRADLSVVFHSATWRARERLVALPLLRQPLAWVARALVARHPRS